MFSLILYRYVHVSIILTCTLLISCPHNCYVRNFLSFTNYKVKNYKEFKTSKGITVYSNSTPPLERIDQKTDELEQCLNLSIKRNCFVVLIPDDWFWSTDGKEQKLPYAANPDLCKAKGFIVPSKCAWVNKPTPECPDVCTWRVATQENYIIVTPPNLRLYKAELARFIVDINNPWANSQIKRCL